MFVVSMHLPCGSSLDLLSNQMRACGGVSAISNFYWFSNFIFILHIWFYYTYLVLVNERGLFESSASFICIQVEERF